MQIAALTVYLWLSTGFMNQNLPEQTARTFPEQDSTTISYSEQIPDSVSANIFLDSIEIQGRVEKPQTVFILPGKDPEVDSIQIDRSFFPEIFRKVEKDMLGRTTRE
jgi:hypothetical protein